MREKRKLSQKQLGIDAGIDPSAASPRMNQYETGKHRPDPNMTERLCQVLGVPVAYLYCEDDDLARVVASFANLNDKDKRKILSMIDQIESLEG
ncbi:Helix-turn-helix domain-containing protein [Thalassolituus maritimus]|uniref:Helix-turn-helix domain-containing protein n=2 Tax=Thalassolituus maritimus TaxID=484498 RepID=A0A1N7PGN8_9GAMM|nr:Helix-turn-helix domain-containing protein [Thalassolituus maritimus]